MIAVSLSTIANATSARTASKPKAKTPEWSANSSSARARWASASVGRPCHPASSAAVKRADVVQPHLVDRRM